MNTVEQKQLETLLLKISEISLTNSLDTQLKDLEKEYKMEDIYSFLSILNTVNKSKIKKILSIQNDHSDTKKSLHNEYTLEEVRTIFFMNSLEDINNKFSKKELEDMYTSLNKAKPLTSYNKKQIANDIYLKFRAENRAKNLHMNYSQKNKNYAVL